MKLYIISQSVNRWYDTYDSAVVAAESEDDARDIHPYGEWPKIYCKDWVAKEEKHLVEVLYIGETNQPRGAILASFNAG